MDAKTRAVRVQRNVFNTIIKAEIGNLPPTRRIPDLRHGCVRCRNPGFCSIVRDVFGACSGMCKPEQLLPRHCVPGAGDVSGIIGNQALAVSGEGQLLQTGIELQSQPLLAGGQVKDAGAGSRVERAGCEQRSVGAQGERFRHVFIADYRGLKHALARPNVPDLGVETHPEGQPRTIGAELDCLEIVLLFCS